MDLVGSLIPSLATAVSQVTASNPPPLLSVSALKVEGQFSHYSC